MRRQLSQPSFVNGFARSKNESVRPDLWPDHAWVPALGVQGSTLFEISSRNDGIITSASWDNTSLVFNGILRSGVNIGRVLSMNFSQRTIFLKFKTTNLTVDQVLVGRKQTALVEGAWNILFDDLVSVNGDSRDKICYFIRGSSATPSTFPWAQSATKILSDVWYTVAVLHNQGVSIDIFINGLEDKAYSQNETTVISAEVNCDATIGYDAEPGRWLTGNISEVVVYNKILSREQIAALNYNPLLPFRRRTIQKYWVPAGGGTTFNAAWVRNSNVIIQPGVY